MAKEFFKDLPDTSTPLSATRINGLLDGEESMGSIVVENIRSKNLLNPIKQTVTRNGVTFTTNNDGSITLNGTATANISYIFSNQKIYGDGGNYYLGITTDYSDIGYNFEVAGYIYNASDEVAKIISPNRGTQTIATNEYVSLFNIYFKSGATFNNFTIFPQLEKGSVATNYNKYINFDILKGEEWKELSLSNEFENYGENYGENYAPLRLKKIGNIVYVQGMIKSKTTGYVIITTLPETYRPKYTLYSICISDDNAKSLVFKPNGELKISDAVNNSWIGIDTYFPID